MKKGLTIHYYATMALILAHHDTHNLQLIVNLDVYFPLMFNLRMPINTDVRASRCVF